MAPPFSGTVAIRAMKDGDFQATIFPGTTAGLQAAVDYLAGGKGKISVGPGTLDVTATIWLHSGCHIQGSGIDTTIIRRATGSMANGQPAHSGAVICSSQFGSNGTISDSSHTLTDITISDLTADGNYTNFGAVTDTALVPSGIRVDYCDGVRLYNVGASNTLGDGFRIRNCRNVIARGLHGNLVGQSATVQARNGVNLIGDYGAAGNWGLNYTVSNVLLENVGDEAIQCSGINQVSISNVDVDTCDFVFEVTDSPTVPGTIYRNWNISNINARNVTDYFITFNYANQDLYENITFSNITVSGHATLHDGGVISFPGTSGRFLKRIKFENCVFTNINTKDTTSRNWCDIVSGDTTGHQDISIRGCTFEGLSTSVRTGDIGVSIRGQNRNHSISSCIFRYVPGVGIRVNDHTGVAGITIQDIQIEDVTVETANGQGFRVTSASATATGTLKSIYHVNCVAKDTNIVTVGAGFDCNISQAGATIQQIFYLGCRAYKTSGVNMTHGVILTQSAGVLDSIQISDCDFSGTATNWLNSSGTPTNVHFTPPTGRGADIPSAATITIPQNGGIFHVTGTTNITNGLTVNKWDNGRFAVLIFDGILTMSDTGTSKLSANYVTTADDTLTLQCDGTNWYEIQRSAN